jgi:hypothetical protein
MLREVASWYKRLRYRVHVQFDCIRLHNIADGFCIYHEFFFSNNELEAPPFHPRRWSLIRYTKTRATASLDNIMQLRLLSEHKRLVVAKDKPFTGSFVHLRSQNLA